MVSQKSISIHWSIQSLALVSLPTSRNQLSKPWYLGPGDDDEALESLLIHGFERLYGDMIWLCDLVYCHAPTHRETPIKQHISRDDRGLWTVLKLVHKRLCDADNGGDNWLMTHGSKYQPGISGKLTSNLRTSKNMNRLGLWQQNNICSHVKNWRVPPPQFLVSVVSWSSSILNNEYFTNVVWLFMVPMYIGIQNFCFWKC